MRPHEEEQGTIQLLMGEMIKTQLKRRSVQPGMSDNDSPSRSASLAGSPSGLALLSARSRNASFECLAGLAASGPALRGASLPGHSRHGSGDAGSGAGPLIGAGALDVRLQLLVDEAGVVVGGSAPDSPASSLGAAAAAAPLLDDGAGGAGAAGGLPEVLTPRRQLQVSRFAPSRQGAGSPVASPRATVDTSSPRVSRDSLPYGGAASMVGTGGLAAAAAAMLARGSRRDARARGAEQDEEDGEDGEGREQVVIDMPPGPARGCSGAL